MTAFFARGGIMSLLGPPGTPPVIPRSGMGDHTTGKGGCYDHMHAAARGWAIHLQGRPQLRPIRASVSKLPKLSNACTVEYGHVTLLFLLLFVLLVLLLVLLALHTCINRRPCRTFLDPCRAAAGGENRQGGALVRSFFR